MVSAIVRREIREGKFLEISLVEKVVFIEKSLLDPFNPKAKFSVD